MAVPGSGSGIPPNSVLFPPQSHMIRPHDKSVVKIWGSCKSLPRKPQGCTLSTWAGTCLDRTSVAAKESLEQPVPPLLGEADDAGPPEVKPTSQKVAGLDLSFLRSAQLGCSPCSRRPGADSTRTLSGGERGHLHQGVTTGPSEDLDMLPAGKLSLWTRVTESINNPSALAPETPTPDKGPNRGHS